MNISEPEKKITLDAALTKRLTGNDTITARYLHENSFEFRPNFKVFINTNHLPQSVIDATAEYNRESDRVAQFVTTCLVEKEDGELANKAVFIRYQEWCRDNGYVRKISSISRRPCPGTAALKGRDRRRAEIRKLWCLVTNSP